MNSEDKKQLKQYPKLGLLNFEGDVIRAYKVNSNKYIIMDGHGEFIGEYRFWELRNFLTGHSDITISDGKTYNYLKEHPEARPKPHKLEEFLGEMYQAFLRTDQYVIIDLRNMDFMKDKSGNINYYDTEEEASRVCGMYEFENAWVMRLIYNHIEHE